MNATGTRQRWGGGAARALPSAVLGVALAGCGSVHGIPVDQIANDIAVTVCPKAWSCCDATQLMGNDTAGTSEPDCETKTANNYRQQLQQVQSSMDAGRARYEQSKVDACLQTIQQSTCQMLNTTNHLAGVPGCESFVTPLVDLGGVCGQDYECISGWCHDDHCERRAGADEACSKDIPCDAGLVCDLGLPDGQQICVVPQANGASCTDLLQCQSTVCDDASMTCVANTAPMCFYSSGCAAAGGGRPSAAVIALFVAFAAVGLARARRRPR
jgi:hypothetical protein